MGEVRGVKAIREAIAHPLMNCKKKDQPARRGRWLTPKESARLALLGKIDRERVVEELVKKYYR